jgi:hypothetical protein
MKFDCTKCSKNCKGVPFDVILNGKKEAYCTDCYVQVKDEFSKKLSCEECVFFDDESCKFEGKMTPANLSGREYFVQREKCGKFKDASDPVNLALKKAEQKEETPHDAEGLVLQLAENGKTLTYHCCHCGWPLKVGAKNPLYKKCPRCNKDLTIIDMAKFIEQHQ